MGMTPGREDGWGTDSFVGGRWGTRMRMPGGCARGRSSCRLRHEEEPGVCRLGEIRCGVWERLARAAAARRALRRWQRVHPPLRGAVDLVLLERRRNPDLAPGILAALAALAPGSGLAARTLLQARLPGLVRLAATAAAVIRGRSMRCSAWRGSGAVPTRRAGLVDRTVDAADRDERRAVEPWPCLLSLPLPARLRRRRTRASPQRLRPRSCHHGRPRSVAGIAVRRRSDRRDL